MATGYFSFEKVSVIGFLLALTTAVMWGVLPIFLQLALTSMDAVTITAYRFIFAAIFVACFLFWRQALPSARQLVSASFTLMLIAIALLAINFVTNVLSLQHISADTVQVVMQLAPLLLMLGSVIFFKEVFTRKQFLALLVLVVGLIVFFNERIPQILASQDENIIGVWLTIAAASSWAVYALIQKRIMRVLTAKQFTLVLYLGCFLVLAPFSHFSSLLEMSELAFYALLFCCCNTIVGYGAFTQAMSMWEGSKVSAVLATTPVVTYSANKIAVAIAPGTFYQAQMNTQAYFGAGMIILGAIFISMLKPRVKLVD